MTFLRAMLAAPNTPHANGVFAHWSIDHWPHCCRGTRIEQLVKQTSSRDVGLLGWSRLWLEQPGGRGWWALAAISIRACPSRPWRLPGIVAEDVGIEHTYDGEFQYFVGGGVAVADCNADLKPDVFLAGGENPSAVYPKRERRGRSDPVRRRLTYLRPSSME